MRKVLKITGYLLLVVVLGIVILYLYADNAPVIHQGYNQKSKQGEILNTNICRTGTLQRRRPLQKRRSPSKSIRFIIQKNWRMLKGPTR